jgi:hypothetical protein
MTREFHQRNGARTPFLMAAFGLRLGRMRKQI